MGGNVPLGYDLPAAGTRILQVNEIEAASVRDIFARYLELGSVHALQRELAAEGIVSKRRITGSGKLMGGTPFSRGALFHLLRNRIYLGQIIHRDQCHDGEHAAIVPEDLFDRVQQHLDANARRHRSAGERRLSRAPLASRIFDAMGEPMSPTFSHGKSGRAWRYYVSASLQKGAPPRDDEIIRRLSAPALERVLAQAVTRWLPGEANPLARIATVHLRENGFAITLDRCRAAELAGRLADGEELFVNSNSTCTIALPIALPLRGGRCRVTTGTHNPAMPDPVLIGALRKAHRMLSRERGMPFCEAAPVSPYDRRLLRLAFLAPDIQRAILAGYQPAGLNLERLMGMEIPLDWAEQRVMLGYA